MKVGDKVKYTIGGKIHSAKVIWVHADGFNITVETDKGTRDNLPISDVQIVANPL